MSRGNNTKGCAEGNISQATTFSVPECKGEPCQVLSLLSTHIYHVTSKRLYLGEEVPTEPGEHLERYNQDIKEARGFLPCVRCNRGISLPENVRLGKREREIILTAPGPDEEEGLLIKGEERAEREAKLRAVRKMTAAGLLFWGIQLINIETKIRSNPHYETDEEGTLWHCWTPVYRIYRRRVAWRSYLGQAVVEVAEEALKAGKRIRWNNYRGRIIELTSAEPELMFEMMKERVREIMDISLREAQYEITALATYDKLKDLNSALDFATGRDTLKAEQARLKASACPRCRKPRRTQMGYSDLDLLLCDDCWKALAREWKEKRGG